MDESSKPPLVAPHVVAGRSALPAFLPVEAWARDRTAEAQARAEARLRSAESEAAEVRRAGEEALRQAVLDGEREALREVERRSRDAVSDARVAMEAWIRAGEEAAAASLPEALRRLCSPEDLMPPEDAMPPEKEE